MKPNTSSDDNLLSDVNHQIGRFMKAFTWVIYVLMALAVAGAVMEFSDVSGGSILFSFAAAMLVLLFLVQIGLSFFYVVAKIKLALLGAFSSLSLSVGFLFLLFRYREWIAWEVLLFITIPLFLITAVFLGMYLSNLKELKPSHRNFLIRNLAVPYVLVVVLGLLPFIMKEKEAQPLETNLDQQEEITTDSTGFW